MNPAGLVAWTAPIVLVILVASLCLALIRLIRGPSLPDRVVALDLMAVLAVGIVAIDAVAMEQPVLLDAAVVLALIAFLGTAAFARYVEKGTLPWQR